MPTYYLTSNLSSKVERGMRACSSAARTLRRFLGSYVVQIEARKGGLVYRASAQSAAQKERDVAMARTSAMYSKSVPSPS